MAKWSGKIGFIEIKELRPGVQVEESTEKPYYGDVLSNYRMWQQSGHVVDDLNINNKISIVSDLYANTHMGYMKWIEFQGMKWKIKSIDISYPRLILTIGDLYNG